MLEHAMELNQDEISGWSASQLLQVLFSEEVSRREEGALKRRIQDANLTYADACYSRYVWLLRIPQFGHEKCPPRWGILLASKKPFIPVNMLAASRGSSASLQTT